MIIIEMNMVLDVWRSYVLELTHKVLHRCWVKWCCNIPNRCQHFHCQPILANKKSTNCKCKSIWALCDLLMYKFFHSLDCLSTITLSISYIVHHIQHFDKACMDTLWFQFAMATSNACSLLLQGTNRQWIGKHTIPTRFIWVTMVSNMRTIIISTSQMTNSMCITNFD